MTSLAQTLGASSRVQSVPQVPSPVQVLGITVEGMANENAAAVVAQASGLEVGQTVTLPGDEAVAEAIRSVYRLGLFSDVKIVEGRREAGGVHLVIQVQEEPRLAEYVLVGISGGNRRDLERKMPLLRGGTVRPSDVERSKQVIKQYYRERGYLLSSVDVQRHPTPEGHVRMEFLIDRGPKIKVEEIRVVGNEAFSDSRIRGRMSGTKETRWWRFWRSETFKQNEYETDLQRIIAYYNDRGFYDARIVRDTFYVENGDDPGVVVEVEVAEGSQYVVRNVTWEGNTVYSDEFLTNALGFERGDVFSRTQLERNLYQNRSGTDLASLYMNRGYMLFNAEPIITVVDGDSLDVHFEVREGDVYQFGDITIVGNTKTKEHVIRRELYTIPGQTFSREAIQESIRRIQQLGYFTEESLSAGPSIDVNEAQKTVDLTFNVAEQSSDQLELSGTWGNFGLVLMLRFTFSNFSAQNLFNGDAWKPLPSGDGQRLSLAVQTNGTFYQSYSVSFTEPWFRARPRPVGFSLSYSRFGGSDRFFDFGGGAGSLQTVAGRVFYERRLQWPDDMFSLSTSLGYQYFHNDSTNFAIPLGVSQFVTLQQSLSRNSLNHPVFPTRGSRAELSLEVAPPLGDFVQYHKWRFRTQWNVPLSNSLAIGLGTDFGYVGSLTGEPVDFERFIVGGSPFDVQGFNQFFGKDIVYMRGYPSAAIGPRRGNEPLGGTILNKYTSELKWIAVQSPQVSASPYVFLDAANTWNGLSSYNPSELFRSAGVGIRLFLPILGMVEMAYGYNFDTFPQVTSRHDGSNQWFFQFTLGQGFGQ